MPRARVYEGRTCEAGFGEGRKEDLSLEMSLPRQQASDLWSVVLQNVQS